METIPSWILDLGSAASPAINYVNGDLTLNGNHTGYGILVVTGTLHFGGNFNWYGTVLVVGDGVVEFTGRRKRDDHRHHAGGKNLGQPHRSEPASNQRVSFLHLEWRRRQRHSVRSLLGNKPDE